MSDFYHVKKNERDYYAKLRILHIMIVSELLKIQKLCARHYGCARHRGRARSVWCTQLNFVNCLVEITKMCPETLLCMVTHATNFEWVFFHQWCQNVLLSTHISPCYFLSVNTRQIFLIGKIRKLKSLFAFDACLRNTLVAFQLDRPERYRQDPWCSPNRSI